MERNRRWIFALYGATGFTGLLAEQGFERYVSLLVGATAAASAVVIFTYFLGFAIGGWAVARFQKQRSVRNPLWLYGAIELLVGISCVVFTFAFHPLMEQLAPLQALSTSIWCKSLIRFALACLFVLPAAVLMGASFPLIAQAVDETAESGGSLWARSYAVNLLGAALAALLGPYALLPLIGIRGSFWLCFSMCLLVFLVATRLASSQDAGRAGARPTPMDRVGWAEMEGSDWLLLAASFASGAVFFALEVLWTHLISVIIGSSIYAFSSMLFVVLTGLLIGAVQAAKISGHLEISDYGALFRKCGFLLVIQFILWGISPLFFVFNPPKMLQHFMLIEGYKLLISVVVMLPSAAALGSVYPSLMRHPALTGKGRYFLVGYMNAANAVGCLSGALAGIFFLVPVLGAEHSLRLMVLVLLVISVLFSLSGKAVLPKAARSFAGAAIIFLPLVFWHWDKFLLTAGLNVYFGCRPPVPATAEAHSSGAVSLPPRVLFFHEAAQGGFTTVVEQGSAAGKDRIAVRTLYTNGKFQGDDNIHGEFDAQFGFAVIPSLFVRNRERALVIGFGTGHTSAALKHLGYQRIDIAEFAPGIVEAARRCFAGINEKILDDSRSVLHLEDGRNLLLVERDRRYDLVTIEVSSVWFAGSTNIYSAQFYKLVKERLCPGGSLQQWCQLHHLGSREVASIIATMRSVFPYVSFWCFGGQGIVVASESPQQLADRTRAELLGVLETSSLRARNPAEYLERILQSRVIGPAGVDRLVSETKPVINTDHNRWLEYSTPRYYVGYYDWVPHNLAFLSRFRQPADAASLER